MDDMRNDGLDQRVHDAYESVSLSPEAEGRILSALLAAQAARDGQAAAEPAATKAPTPAEVLPGPSSRRRSRLAIVLPAAACLALAFVVGRAVIGGGAAEKAEMMAATSEEAVEEAAVADSYDGALPDSGAMGEASAEEGEVPVQEEALAGAGESADSAKAVDVARVVLVGGEAHDLVVDGGALVEVGPELAGEPVGTGEAWGVDGEPLGPCEVLSPADGTGLAGYWLVRPDGSDVLYLADLAS